MYITAEFQLINKIEGMSTPYDWPTGVDKSTRDVKSLLKNGSNNIRIWMTIYGNARTKNKGHDEDAVE
jgi:hypothetical protein